MPCRCYYFNNIKNELMKKFIMNHKLYLIGGVIGAVLGYVYYVFIGCNSGSCPITSSPIMSVIWGAVMGGLLLSMFDKKKKTYENNEKEYCNGISGRSHF